MSNHDIGTISIDRKKWMKQQDVLQEKINDLQTAWMEKDRDRIFSSLSNCASLILSIATEMGVQDDLLKKCLDESIRNKKNLRLLKLSHRYHRQRRIKKH